MKISDSLSVAPFDLHAAAARQPWLWLVAIAQRVGFAVEIVNESGIPLPQIVPVAVSPLLRGLISGPGSPGLRAGITAAIRTNERQRVSIGSLEALCAPLTVGDAVVGAIVLAREADSQGSTEVAAELDAIGNWLAQAVAAQLDVPRDEGEAFDRVSSLDRLLHEVVDNGVERDVLVAFAEALIAWDCIEFKGYVEDLQGEFVLGVATPGTDRSQPRTLPGQGVWSDGVLTRLTPSDASRLGFPSGKDVILTRIGGLKSESWLLAFSGAFGPRDESRLRLYVDLLGEALTRAATIAETRTNWAVLHQLFVPGHGLAQAGEAALAELAGAVDAVGAALVVTNSTGIPTLSLGDGEMVSVSRAGSGDQLLSILPVLEGSTLTLAVRRARGHAFTRREQHIVDRAAAVFAAWLPGVLKAAPQGPDRRTETRGFDSVIDRTAARNVQDGLDVSVVVLAVAAAVSRPNLLHEWVTRLRAELRPSDLAGTMSEGEIGILLSGVGAADVVAIRMRLLRRARIDDAIRVASGVSVGTASRAAGSPAGPSLVRLAQQDAVQSTAGPTTEWP